MSLCRGFSANISLTRAAATIVILITVILLLPLAASAVYISPGYDLFFTDYTSSSVLIPQIGLVPLEGFAVPGPPDPTQLFPLPPGLTPPTGIVGFRVTWLDPHGTVVGPDSKHKVTQLVEPILGVWPFDTVIERKSAADIAGVGDETTIPIEIVWLSLKSVQPVDLGDPAHTQVDVYAGLHPGSQIEGKTKLTSTTLAGEAGTIDLGLKGTTSDDPASPDFLGLPVIYDVLFIPHGMDPIPANVIYRQDGVVAMFHGNTMSPSGTYVIVPEPNSLAVVGLAAVGLLIQRRDR